MSLRASRASELTARVAAVAVDAVADRPERTFSYLLPEDLGEPAPGSLVLVPYGNRSALGYLMALTRDAVEDRTLKPLEAVVSEPMLTDDLLALALDVAVYYRAPIGGTLAAMLPPGLEPNTGARSHATAPCRGAARRCRADALRARARRGSVARSPTEVTGHRGCMGAPAAGRKSTARANHPAPAGRASATPSRAAPAVHPRRARQRTRGPPGPRGGAGCAGRLVAGTRTPAGCLGAGRARLAGGHARPVGTPDRRRRPAGRPGRRATTSLGGGGWPPAWRRAAARGCGGLRQDRCLPRRHRRGGRGRRQRHRAGPGGLADPAARRSAVRDARRTARRPALGLERR